MENPNCPVTASLLAFLGAAFGLSFASLGSAYGTWKSALGVFAVCELKPEFLYRSLLPVIMAGIVGIYGLVTAVIIGPVVSFPYHLLNGYASFCGGISVGLAGLASGITIGVSGNASVRAVAENEKLLMGSMLILIFGEILGLYGFITVIILYGKRAEC